MDPLTIIGAASSVGQLVDLADKAATSAWNLTQSILQAPEEVAKLAEKLIRFKLLIEQTQNQRLDGSSIDELFPSGYRDVLYKLLESSVKALENLESVQQPLPIGSINVRGRVRWAAIDKRRARDLLADIRDAESSLDTAMSMATMRIASRNQVSLAAVRNSQEMFQPKLMDEITEFKKRMNEQLSNAVEKITIHAETKFGESQNKVKDDLNEVASLINTIVACGETQLDMLQKLTNLQLALSNDVNCLNNRLPNRRSQALASCRRTQGAEHFKKGMTQVKAQQFDATNRYNPSGSSASTGLGSPISTQLLRYEMTRTRQSLFWQSQSFDDSLSNDNIRPKLDMSVALTSSQVKRKLRLVLRAEIRLIRQQIIQFDLTIQHSARHWMSLPRLGLSLRPIYIRPADAPIFRACHDRDLEAVRYLLDAGEATIYDVDSESRCGLLEHAFRIINKSLINKPHRRPRLQSDTKLQPLMHYLLDAGYDPNVFNGFKSLPAILSAFEDNSLDLVTQLIGRGAEIDSFSHNPTSLMIGWPDNEYFHEQLNILISTGFSDWKAEEGGRSLLHAAVSVGDWESLLFSLNVVGLIPRENARLSSPLIFLFLFALSSDDHNDVISLGAALLECGADINDGGNQLTGPLLYNSCNIIKSQLNTTAHFCLYCGANPRLAGFDSWFNAWEPLYHYPIFRFVQKELLLTHLLLHGADPFEPAYIHHESECRWWDDPSKHKWDLHTEKIEIRELARAWSFSTCYYNTPSSWVCNCGSEQDYEAFEEDRIPRVNIKWHNNGRIVKSNPDVRGGQGVDNESEASDEDCSDSSESDSEEYDEDEEGSVDISDDSDIHSNGSLEYSNDSECLFYQNISTEEGRQRMSTFPLVQLLCNALNRAGYRAEMDSEGDIWFEDEDGDMYYDAVEFQSNSDNYGLKGDCYICRNMEKYGLGEIPKEIQRGKQKLYAHREEVKAGKRKWCM